MYETCPCPCGTAALGVSSPEAQVRAWWEPWAIGGALLVAVGVMYAIVTSKGSRVRERTQLRVIVKRN